MSMRVARVAHQIQQEIAIIVQRELKDPGIGFVTITGVELSKDLRHAKVRFSCLGSDADLEESRKALQRSAGFIHELLKKRFRLKAIPHLEFRFDESISEGIAIQDVLDKIR